MKKVQQLMHGVRLYCVTLFFCPDDRLTSIKQTLPQLHYREVLQRSEENIHYCSTVSHVTSVELSNFASVMLFSKIVCCNHVLQVL